MAGKFAAEHASAYDDVAANGMGVVFTPNDSSLAPIEGVAMRVKGNPRLYDILKLVESEPVSLYFVPKIYGNTPPLASSVLINGTQYAAKSVEPFAPDGVTITADIVVAR